MLDSAIFQICVKDGLYPEMSYDEYIDEARGKLVEWFKEQNAEIAVGTDIIDNVLGATETILSFSAPITLARQFEADMPDMFGPKTP